MECRYTDFITWLVSHPHNICLRDIQGAHFGCKVMAKFMQREMWDTEFSLCLAKKNSNGIWVSFVYISFFPDFVGDFYRYHDFPGAGRGLCCFFYPLGILIHYFCFIYTDYVPVKIVQCERTYL